MACVAGNGVFVIWNEHLIFYTLYYKLYRAAGPGDFCMCVLGRSVFFVPMMVDKAQLLYSLHGNLLKNLYVELGSAFAGLAQAARCAKNR